MSPKKTILFVEANEDGTVGGSYFSLQLLVKCLDKELYSPIVVLYDDIPLAREMFAEISKLIIFHNDAVQSGTSLVNFLQPLLVTWRKIKSLIFRVIFPFAKIISILIRNRVDMVHLNNSASVCWNWLLAAKILRITCVAHQRGEFPVHKKSIEQAKKFNKILCISKAIQKPFELNNITNTQLIYNPIDVVNYRKQVKKGKKIIRNEFKVGGSAPLIGMVGNFQEWKGQLTLIRAVKLLKMQFPDLVCLLVGSLPVNSIEDKAYFQKVKQLIEDLNLKKQIIITGFRTDVPDLINALDVQLHCSNVPEPFGRVLIEGMCLEQIVVATNIGGPCEIIEDGVSGILIPPNDHTTLCNKIGDLLEDEKLREKIGKAAFKRVSEKFSLGEFKTEIHECYKGIESSK